MNFRRLAAAAETVPEWAIRQQAVAGETGARALLIRESWSHALVSGEADGDRVAVRAISLADVLADDHGDRRVVKLDIEGAECEALARTPRELLARVDELVLEPHPEAGCDPAAIVAIATAAGLRPIHQD